MNDRTRVLDRAKQGIVDAVRELCAVRKELLRLDASRIELDTARFRHEQIMARCVAEMDRLEKGGDLDPFWKATP